MEISNDSGSVTAAFNLKVLSKLVTPCFTVVSLLQWGLGGGGYGGRGRKKLRKLVSFSLSFSLCVSVSLFLSLW